MAVLFYTIGYPGAGKTSFARALSGWLGGVHLQADKIGLALFVMPKFSHAERVAVYQHMDYQAITALNQDRHVLYDGTVNSLEQREHIRRIAAEHNRKAVGLWLTLPVEIAKERAGRLRNVGDSVIGGRKVPPEIFDRHMQSFQEPNDEELVLRIDGVSPFFAQYDQLYHQLRSQDIPNFPRFIQL